MKKIYGGLLMLGSVQLSAVGTSSQIPGEKQEERWVRELSIRDSRVWVTQNMYDQASEQDKHIARERAQRIAHMALAALHKDVVPDEDREYVLHHAALALLKAGRFKDLMRSDKETNVELRSSEEFERTLLLLLICLLQNELIDDDDIQMISSRIVRSTAIHDTPDNVCRDFEYWCKFGLDSDLVRAVLYPGLISATAVASCCIFQYLGTQYFDYSQTCPTDSWLQDAWEHHSDTMSGINNAMVMVGRLMAAALGGAMGLIAAETVDASTLLPSSQMIVARLAARAGFEGDDRKILNLSAGLKSSSWLKRLIGRAQKRLSEAGEYDALSKSGDTGISLQQTHNSAIEENVNNN